MVKKKQAISKELAIIDKIIPDNIAGKAKNHSHNNYYHIKTYNHRSIMLDA